jgi:VIT1/CCC1 family predicted Fe2+/Mn2+ transporter
MEVISSAIVTNRTVCNETLEAITGTITCDVSSLVNSSASVNVYIYVNGNLKVMDSLVFDNSTHSVPMVIFIGFLLLLALGIFFMESKEGTIIITIIGMIFLVALGIIKGKVIGIASGIMWLIIVGIILLIKVNGENK